MNSYQIYQRGNIPNNRIRQNDMRFNYVYNHANQNIDHLRENFSNNQREAPIRVTKNVYRNESNEISSILNRDPYHFNNRVNESNSSNNYNSTNYSSFQNNNNENNLPNNNEINRRSQYSNFYRNNNNYNEMNNYPKMPIYPRNSNMNSMNNINRLDINRIKNNNLNSNEMINFNGINMNIGSRFNNSNHHNNFNNISQNNSYENNFRRSTYSNKSENISIGNNHYNINLSSITSQDIYQSYEKQKKENERKKKEEYSNFLKKQIQEKNKRKELEKQKRLKEEMEFEQKYQNDYNRWEQKDLNEKSNNNKIIDVDNQPIVKRTINENSYGKEANDLDKNILETLQRNQYPLINDDIKQIEKINNKNKKNNYKIEDNELSKEKVSTHRSMIKSGLNIMEGNKSKENFYQKEINNENNLNNSNKRINSNKETELYLDKVIEKTDLLTQNLNKGQVNDDQRMKDILKILDNNKNDKINKINNVAPKNNSTPDKNRIFKNKSKEPQFQNINLGAINFHSKYEDNENINNLNKYKTSNKPKYTSNMKDNEDNQLKESMKGVSEFIPSTSKKKSENITGINLFSNFNSKNTATFNNERAKDRKYILKGDLLQNQNSNKKSETIDIRDSLNSNMKLTFGEGGNVKFIMENHTIDKYSNKANESLSTLNDTKNQERSLKQYSFGERIEKERNKRKEKLKEKDNESNLKKEEKEEEEDIDEDDEEKYDIKVNSENDINYDNMLKSTKKSDLNFLDFDQFCDIENDDEEKNKNKKKKKKKKTTKRQKDNMENINEDDEICNITISDKENDGNKKSEKDNNNDNVNKMTESRKVQMQLNFFSDSVTKGISHKRNDKSIFKSNNENNDDINLLSKESLDKIKNKKLNDDKVEEINRNILDESDDLKDSYGENLLKNIDKYRGELQND